MLKFLFKGEVQQEEKEQWIKIEKVSFPRLFLEREPKAEGSCTRLLNDDTRFGFLMAFDLPSTLS